VGPGSGGERDATQRELDRPKFGEAGQAEVAVGIEAPPPGVTLCIDSQGTVEGHRIGQCGDPDTGGKVDLDGTVEYGGRVPLPSSPKLATPRPTPLRLRSAHSRLSWR